MEKETLYSQDFFVSANESNPEGELAVNILVSDIIVIATAHANSLGIGNPSMEHLNAGWVLSRLTVEMDHYPKVNQHYRISTWVEAWNRHFSTRDFEILDEEGNAIGYARSVWMVLNTITHENFGLSHLSLPADMVSDKICPISRQEKHLDIHREDIRKEIHSGITANLPTYDYTFKYNDIDFYRHVNTVRYITLLLNSYTLSDFDRAFISRLELSFLHEGNFGETVEIRRFAEGPTTSFSLFSPAKEKPVLFARVSLTERKLR